MKKLLFVLLVFILCLSLVACGENKEPTIDDNNTPRVEGTDTTREPEIIEEPEIIDEPIIEEPELTTEVTSGDETPTAEITEDTTSGENE